MFAGVRAAVDSQTLSRADLAAEDVRRMSSNLAIVRGYIHNLPSGARARVDPRFRHLLSRRKEPIPYWRVTVSLPGRPKIFTITVYSTTKIGPRRKKLSFQIQLADMTNLPTAMRFLQKFFFRAHPFDVARDVTTAMTNVQRRVRLRPGASLNLLRMGNPEVPGGMGYSAVVSERREDSQVCYRVVRDLDSDPEKERDVAVNMMAQTINFLGARGYKTSTTITWAVIRNLLDTPDMFFLHLDWDGAYNPRERGPVPTLWRPGVAGIDVLTFDHVIEPETMGFQPTVEAFEYLQAMKLGITVPRPKAVA